MAGVPIIKNNFGVEKIGNTEFINFYSDTNSILHSGEKCFFLFANIYDIHRPLIGEGIIILDKFIDGLNKIYFIQLQKIHESPLIIDNYIFNNKIILTNQYKNGKVTSSSKATRLKKDQNIFEFFEYNLMKVESFFVRKEYNQLIQLRSEYLEVIRDDLQNQIKEIDLCLSK